MLDAVDSVVKEKLLHGEFLEDPILEAVYMSGKIRIPGFRIIRPLTTAIAFGSFHVLQVLLDHEIDVYRTDINKNNIIHSLVYLSYLDEIREDVFVKIYEKLANMLEVKKLKELLFSENDNFLRPLELAAHVGSFEMYKAIFDTKSVYLVRQQVFRSLYHISWYDVTDYETLSPTNRRNKSPLLFFIFIDHERLRAATKSKIFQSEPVKDWICKKCYSYGPFIWIWFGLRVLFIFVFFIHDIPAPISVPSTNSSSIDFGNSPCISEVLNIPNIGRYSAMIYLIIHSSMAILFDIVEAIFAYRAIARFMRRLPRRMKTYLVYYRLYRAVQFLLEVNTLLAMSVEISENVSNKKAPSTLKHFFYLIECSCMVWSILYFCQLVPFLGYFVITIQRMIKDLIRFAVLFFLMLIPFALTFRRIAKDETVCVEAFRTIPLSIYTTFTVMLNMVNFTEFTFSDNFLSTGFVHFVFVFLVAILLLNFLIALFSSSVSEITENRDVIMTIQRLSVYWTLEYRVGTFYKICKRARKKMNKQFLMKNGRIYITKVTVCCGKPKPSRALTIDMTG